MTAPDGVDAAHLPDPAFAAAHGIKVVAGYIGWQSWKCVTPAYIRALHQHGLGFFELYEDSATNALGGTAQGTTDGIRARNAHNTLAQQVGYAPQNQTAVCFAVDFDTNPTEYPAIDAYLRACDAQITGHLLGDYGEADLLDHEATLAQVGFGAYAWSKNRVSTHADLQQYLNGQAFGGTTVDYDHVINLAGLGAWWPPGHQLDSANATPIGGLVSITDTQLIADAAQGARTFDAGVEFQGRILNALAADGVPQSLAAIAAAVTAVGGRVAQLQAAVAGLPATAPTAPTAAVAIDPAVITAAVTEAVNAALPGVVDAAVAKLTLTLGVKP